MCYIEKEVEKPCPFCGSKAELLGWEVDEDDWFYGFMYYVRCTNIECSASTSDFWEEEKAIEKWNNEEVSKI